MKSSVSIKPPQKCGVRASGGVVNEREREVDWGNGIMAIINILFSAVNDMLYPMGLGLYGISHLSQNWVCTFAMSRGHGDNWQGLAGARLGYIVNCYLFVCAKRMCMCCEWRFFNSKNSR